MGGVGPTRAVRCAATVDVISEPRCGALNPPPPPGAWIFDYTLPERLEDKDVQGLWLAVIIDSVEAVKEK